ncbi:MAG: hypothetical protein KatS3mg024_1543 [Armatimonadota bacterium]|nr:MAG: hypothetical protein KatS3mg024_1543 [Armatimonadota bacterium]
MAAHDIIDNRKEILADHIDRILDSTSAARFAVGYFFISGLKGIASKLVDLSELRLLIGNTTNRETLEQLAEGYRSLEMVKEAAEAQSYPKRVDSKRMVSETAEAIREAMEMMDQSDEDERVILNLARMIEEGRLKVRVYTKGRLHAKAYIFDYGPVYDASGQPIERHEKGIAIVGSSNLTLSGLTHNTELNVVVQGNDNHAELVRWFDELWNESEEFDEAFMQEIKQSWAASLVRPYDIYMKTLYRLVRDRLESEADQDLLWDDDITSKLADFQKVAVKQAVQMIRDYGGVFVSDVVGLGKSYIGAAIVKHFERTEHARPLIICPAGLVEMWERYNEEYDLNARVLSMGYLSEGKDVEKYLDPNDGLYRDRDFVLIDESHNLSNPETQRYRAVEAFLATQKKCCMLTATPRNKTAWDVYHQIKLFHQSDKTDLPIEPADLKEYFKSIERGNRKLPDLLVHILIRRTRNHILRWYGYDADTHEPVDPSRFADYASGRRRAYVIVGGKHQFFPKRELETIEYSIEDTYQGLYQEIRSALGRPGNNGAGRLFKGQLTFARFGLWHYVRPEKQRQEPYASLQRAGANLRGLIRILLFKRFESSVYAFRATIQRLLRAHERFLAALQEGIVPAGEDARNILYESDVQSEVGLMDALRQASGHYNIEDFDLSRLRKAIEHDISVLKHILGLVEPITAAKDAKLQTLFDWLRKEPLNQGKLLIFTQFADTAKYLYENLNPKEERDDIEVVYSSDKSRARAVGRFAPRANPSYKFQEGECEISTLVATDVLSEGLNLQDCDKIINYDLHWNPVRLIQRFGRIDRIGSEHDVIYGFNFLPELGIERNLGLKEVLRNRIQEIHDTIGEDAAILDSSEQLNEEALYAIYERKGEQLSLFEDEEDELLDLNEAEEIVRLLKKESPAEFERIASMPDGVRSAVQALAKGFYVFCESSYPGRSDLKAYQELVVFDSEGNEVTRDVPRVLGMIKCAPETPTATLPEGYNSRVARAKRQFAEVVKQRQAEREKTLGLSQGQKYVLRELRGQFALARDEEIKSQIDLLAKAFRGPVTNAVNKELNRLRRNGATGQDLLHGLRDIYYQHNMREWADRRSSMLQEKPVSRIVCSEGLV